MNHDATLSGISSCNHKHYSLSCEEFETLLERADHTREWLRVVQRKHEASPAA